MIIGPLLRRSIEQRTGVFYFGFTKKEKELIDLARNLRSYGNNDDSLRDPECGLCLDRFSAKLNGYDGKYADNFKHIHEKISRERDMAFDGPGHIRYSM